jgi:hypothetical protein
MSEWPIKTSMSSGLAPSSISYGTGGSPARAPSTLVDCGRIAGNRSLAALPHGNFVLSIPLPLPPSPIQPSLAAL